MMYMCQTDNTNHKWTPKVILDCSSELIVVMEQYC